MNNSMTQALDDVPKGLWFAAMILGFVFCWPLGLAVLFYLIGSGKMNCFKHGRWSGRDFGPGANGFRFHGYNNTGNSAFDAYRDETLRRLDEEQKAFTEFVNKLRRAKDQQEFDQFMADHRAQQTSAGTSGTAS